MNRAKTPAPATELSRRGVPRGRVDKRQAILQAAFKTFAREGYGQSCVREIAAEAGVAKPTIYNHLGDKETLFREAMRAAAGRTVGQGLAALDQLRDVQNDVRAGLEDAGHRLLLHHCDEESQALRRLLHAEAARFPELLELIQQESARHLHDALADRLARLALSGLLRTNDPDLAAEQFLALLTGPMELRSRLGTRKVPDAELRAVGRSAVDTFLCAYAPGSVDA
ncbi:TetR/AcrR family transcriptional regulator [Streptomyces pinistramenti]|uniref:TetR/AcrR family transcriptional regulator n=1 Tax=Streptomyces pinistramenti TaxID=2884812 RepID=UPI001D0618B6|nr:TetR/AcrR family transcriptional regulator [Streptomyces pinistramenti]MCB5910002.1 TetR/AcrR family transcriptional regulator [Streptomyces pinistramenti]